MPAREQLIGRMTSFNISNRNGFPSSRPHPQLIANHHIGIEVEVENANSFRFSNSAWENKPDGSLRNGRELVLRRPLNGQALVQAIADFAEAARGANLDLSWRCSTHFHMNVTDMTVSSLKRLLLAKAVYEKALFRCGCENRLRNNFCMPFGVAQSQIVSMARSWSYTGERFISSIVQNSNKYAALNILPIVSFGSVELRISNAMTSEAELIAAVNRFMMLKVLAETWEGDDESFIDYLATNPVSSILTKKITLGVDLFMEDIQEGLINARDMISLGKPDATISDRHEFDLGTSIDVSSHIYNFGDFRDEILGAMDEDDYDNYDGYDFRSMSRRDLIDVANAVSSNGGAITNILHGNRLDLYRLVTGAASDEVIAIPSRLTRYVRNL